MDENKILNVLAQLALWMHEINPGFGLVKRVNLYRKLEQIFLKNKEKDPEITARQFMVEVSDNASLLLEFGIEQFGFIHLSFKDYLAAMGIAKDANFEAQPVIEKLAPHIGEREWREVTLLAVSYIGVLQDLPIIAGKIVEGLAYDTHGAASEAAVLAGEAVQDAMPDGISAESKDEVIRALIPAMQNQDAKPDLRRKAGLALGRFGWQPADLDDFVEIKPKIFQYAKDEYMYGFLQSKRFWIGKYPVTNLQYERFIKDDGYKNSEWWSKDGWKWKQENELTEPLLWKDQLFNNPIFPVVSIRWFEAQAYCKWLAFNLLGTNELGGYTFRLPTEEEWVRATRFGDWYDFPWNGFFDKKYANTSECKIKSTTAVCTFPLGRSKEGVWDLVGNVWEWTEFIDENDHPSFCLRGSSWGTDGKYGSCDSRLIDYPEWILDRIGFRVVKAKSIIKKSDYQPGWNTQVSPANSLARRLNNG